MVTFWCGIVEKIFRFSYVPPKFIVGISALFVMLLMFNGALFYWLFFCGGWALLFCNIGVIARGD